MTEIQLPFELRRVESGPEVERARSLFQEYQRSLGIDLEFQDFSAELSHLPGAYAPPRGRLYMAMMARQAAGCVALRPLSDDECELKRLYVRPDFRSRGIGRLLTRHVIGEAHAIGYSRIVLDTLENMAEAQALYTRLGFTDIAPYNATPFEGTRWMGLDLKAA
ncbi:MAG TPA: GNAT family N-acetyltransferase [Burkholderiales bacterium]|nr:GNAT family N-acetyltransferase [Burkholderiales bacterium]